jgi:hypothetical protein
MKVQILLQAMAVAEVGFPYLALEVVVEVLPYWASGAEEVVVGQSLMAVEVLDERLAEEVVEGRYCDLVEVEECMTKRVLGF